MGIYIKKPWNEPTIVNDWHSPYQGDYYISVPVIWAKQSNFAPQPIKVGLIDATNDYKIEVHPDGSFSMTHKSLIEGGEDGDND